MSTLNKLPDGSPAPKFRCTAVGHFDGEEKVLELTEWWYEGKKVETIEQSADSYFYDAFDKSSFEVISIKKIKARTWRDMPSTIIGGDDG